MIDQTTARRDLQQLGVIAATLEARAGGPGSLKRQLPEIVAEALEFVLDPIKTARTRIDDLDKVEKSFIGLKVETPVALASSQSQVGLLCKYRTIFPKGVVPNRIDVAYLGIV